MIQQRTPKKVKGARKKARLAEIERLKEKFPTWFEGKSEREINRIVSAYRASNPSNDDEFPSFVIKCEEIAKGNLFLNNILY